RTGRAGATGDALSLCSEKDARLLADIEKLTKQKLEPVELTGFAPRSGRDRGSERNGERGGRRERDDGRGEGRGSRSNSQGTNGTHGGHSYAPGTRGAYAAPRKQSVDPFFTQPYVPSDTASETNQPAENKSSIKPQKQKVAALLGGKR